jgi:PucR family transcriptional regulator, purine catabolism regulatory protein
VSTTSASVKGAGARPPAPALLGDLMSLPALEGARLVPPDAPLDRPVRSLAMADGGPPSEPDALLLAAGAPPAVAPAGCAAVLCRAEPDGDPGAPVIVLPEGASWTAALAALAVAVAPAAAIGRAEAARAALRAPLLEGRGYSALALVAREMVVGGVACLDEQLDLLGASGVSPEQRQELEEAVTRARSHRPASVLGPFVNDELPQLARLMVAGAEGPIGVVVAWLSPPLAPGDHAVLCELVEACAMEHAREEARVETEARLRGDLIEELAAGETVSRESLVRRARHLGADLSRGAVALLGKLLDPHTEGRLITDQRLVRRFLQQVRATIDVQWPGALIDWNAGRLLILLPPAASGDGEEVSSDVVEERALTLAKRLIVATRQSVPGLALSLSLSRHVREPERLGAALGEAQLALSIGERLGRVGEVTTFEETGTYKLLFQVLTERPGELQAFCGETLGPLLRYDEQYQTDLVATLATYFAKDCNLAETAGTLYTHRHTVRYRLDRITVLTGLDIARTDDREKLSLALKAMRLLGMRVPAAGTGGERTGRSARAS